MAPVFDPDTLRMAYSEAMQTSQRLNEWYDALDRKAFAIFAASSALITGVPTFGPTLPPVALGAAIIAWGASSLQCYLALQARVVGLDASPTKLNDHRWLTIPPSTYMQAGLRDAAQAFKKNLESYSDKATAVKRALLFAAVEVLFFAFAFVAR